MLRLLYRQSWWRFLLAVVAAILGGLASAGLVKIISAGAAGSAPLTSWAASFFALCGVLFLVKTFSEWALVGLAQELICSMRIELCRKILATPYKRLESLGKARLLVFLITDIDTITAAARLGPTVFANLIVILACLGYLALLSWQLFLWVTICLILGAGAYHAAERPAFAKCAERASRWTRCIVIFARSWKGPRNYSSMTSGADTLLKMSSLPPPSASATCL